MDKRTHIISVAIELFAAGGFDNTSIREISQKAGVNVAMINYYFGSKEKLIEAMLEYKSSYSKARLEELHANTEMSEIEKINVIIQEYVTRIFSNPSYHRIVQQELLLNTRPEIHAGVRNLIFNNFFVIKKILKEGMDKGIFRKIDPELTIASIYGTINHCMQTPAFLMQAAEVEITPDYYKDEKLQERIITHLQQLMQAHLLKN